MPKKIDELDNLAELVASGITIRDAAKQLGISEATAYRTSSRSDFGALVSAKRTEKTEGLSGQLLGGAEDAIRELRVQATTAERPSDRIAACRVLLDKVLAFADQADIRRRLDKLEQRADEEASQAREPAFDGA